MSDFSIQEMLAMQRTLQEKYKDKWEAIRPEAGKHKLLWMVGEIGEVVDIVKKNGDVEPLENKDLRKHLVEEMADVLAAGRKPFLFLFYSTLFREKLLSIVLTFAGNIIK